MHTARSLITELELQPHPEGGWFREVFRSAGRLQPSALPERYLGSRAYATSIVYLLETGEVSRFHRLRSDELWHFYEGAPLLLHTLSDNGDHTVRTLGRDLRNGEQFMLPVPQDVWMAAEVRSAPGYSLLGCTVAPGFDFSDFELGKRADLLAAFPAQNSIIERFTTP